MPDVKMQVSALSDVGRARTTNEDAFAVTDLASGKQIDVTRTTAMIDVQDRGVLLALSDGMGGAQAGEVASALVLASLQEALADEARGDLAEQLEQAVHRANKSVFQAARAVNMQGMGATLTAVFVRGPEAYIAEVGDSRAYLLRNGRLRQITRDQSLVQLMVDQGVLDAADARKAPGKNVILQAMGLSSDVRVAIARLQLRTGDRFLLCSDGVTNAVSDPELQQILTQSDPRAAVETMIALANDRGGDDNETAIVADLSSEDLPSTEEFETVTETYSVLKTYDAAFKGNPATKAAVEAAARAAGVKPRKRSSKPPEPSPPTVIAADADASAVPQALDDDPSHVSLIAEAATPAPVHHPRVRPPTPSPDPPLLVPAYDPTAPSVFSKSSRAIFVAAVGIAIVALIAIVLLATGTL